LRGIHTLDDGVFIWSQIILWNFEVYILQLLS